MDTHLLNKKLWGGGALPWAITPRDLLRHAYILGQTGTGKSALLQRLATAHINAGAGVALLDPHGDLADVLLDAIPRHRTDDLIYFNPAGDTERPLSINLLDQVPPEAHHLVASGIVEALQNLYADSWGPRLEWILYQSLRALLEYGVFCPKPRNGIFQGKKPQNGRSEAVFEPYCRTNVYGISLTRFSGSIAEEPSFLRHIFFSESPF